jgi:hypothetical protein
MVTKNKIRWEIIVTIIGKGKIISGNKNETIKPPKYNKK